MSNRADCFLGNGGVKTPPYGVGCVHPRVCADITRRSRISLAAGKFHRAMRDITASKASQPPPYGVGCGGATFTVAFPIGERWLAERDE